MNEQIRQRALELDFDDCRFTTAAAPATAGQFQNWLAGKHHGEMAWLERTAAKRLDPHRVLPEARSVICLAASYAGEVEGHLPQATHHVSRFTPPSPVTPNSPITTTCLVNA